MNAPTLYIGNKNYSSWSMRPWLALKWAGIAFEEKVIALGGPGYGKSKILEILSVSPSGRVPALALEGATITDSLAICEWAAEQAPSLWPADRLVRARARSAACEMHSSFAALRTAMSMNIRRRVVVADWEPNVIQDVNRVVEIWTAARAAAKGGLFLFGARSIADAFFAPVATRFRTYGVILPADAQAYCDAIFADAAFREWEAGAEQEPWAIPEADQLYT
ncbi:MAG: glutathione S-transferase family protein [Alphaproteobacteria bacterium]|nr:glutathione S-transferase family protein [Alphaproteobacteria bacterium]